MRGQRSRPLSTGKSCWRGFLLCCPAPLWGTMERSLPSAESLLSYTHTHTRIHTNAHIHTNPRTQSLTFAHNTLTLYLNFFFIFFLFSSPLLFQRVSLWSAFSFCVSLSFDPRCRRSKPLSPACVMCWLQERRPSLYCSRGAGAGHSYVNYSAVQTGSLHTYTPHNTPLTHSCHLCAYLNRNRPQMFDYAAMNLHESLMCTHENDQLTPMGYQTSQTRVFKHRYWMSINGIPDVVL